MAKAPKSTRKVYIALRTIQRGNPKNIETIPAGDEVDLTEEEANEFVARGFVREETVKGGKGAAEGGEGDGGAQ